MQQVIVAHAAFAVTGIGSGTAGCNDYWRKPSLKKVESMVKAGAIHRGGTSGIFSRAEYDDGVGGVNFLSRGFACDSHTSYSQPKERGGSERSHY
jgi:hypothetical protein